MPFFQFLQKTRCGDSHLPKSQHCGVAYGIFVALLEQLACHQLCSKPDNLIINMGNKHSPCTSAFAILSIYLCRSSLLILLGKQWLWVLPAPIPQKKSVKPIWEEPTPSYRLGADEEWRRLGHQFTDSLFLERVLVHWSGSFGPLSINFGDWWDVNTYTQSYRSKYLACALHLSEQQLWADKNGVGLVN